MDCPNCGHLIDTSSGESYVKCEYCRSKVAVMSRIENLLSVPLAMGVDNEKKKQIEVSLSVANIDLANRNYKSAYDAYGKILEGTPFVWEAIVNQAICVFWMGREDMQHMRQVFALLQKADRLSSSDPAVAKTRKEIAHNLAVLGAKKERYGDNVSWSLQCFKVSKTLVNSEQNRDEIINAYAKVCCQEINSRLRRGLERDKKKYDPPMNDIQTLLELSSLLDHKDKEILISGIAFGSLRLAAHNSDENLKGALEKLVSAYSSRYPGESLPQVVFPRFGSPRIE